MNPTAFFRSGLAATLLGLGLSTSASALTSVCTVPVGAMTYTIKAGTGIARTTTSFSMPLSDTPGAQGVIKGTMSGLTATSVNVVNAGWIPGALSSLAAPYQIRITSGGAEGAILSISANTNVSLTVSGYDLTKLAAVGDGFELVPLDTLGTLFGSTTSTLSLIGGTSPSTADIVYLGKNTLTGYYFNTSSGKWFQTIGPPIDASTTPIPFSATITVSRLAATSTQVTNTGSVPATKYRTQIVNTGTTYTQTGFPSDVTLGALAIQNKVLGWVKGNSALADVLSIPVGAGWSSYYHNGSNWVLLVGPAVPQDALVTIQAGSSIRITKRGAIAGSSDFINPLPYTL